MKNDTINFRNMSASRFDDDAYNEEKLCSSLVNDDNYIMVRLKD